MAYLAGQPIIVLKEGTQRSRGRDAQRSNITAAKVIAETVKSTLGPKGMDKMLVDSLGDVVITNDGVTILDEMDVEHPAAKMMVEIAKTQEDEVGDGTTTAVVFAGELLKKAEGLLDQSIHPTVITYGYQLAAKKAQDILNEIADPITGADKDTLKKVAMTSMTGRGAEVAKEYLADLIVDALIAVAEQKGSKYTVDIDNIKTEKKEGGSSDDTELIRGVVIDKEVVHPAMPKRVAGAKIALLNCALEIKKTETDAKISISSPDQLKSFLDEEEDILKAMADKIEKSGANVVFCQKGIDDLVQHYLAKRNILAIRRIKKSDMELLARATGAKILTRIEDLTSSELGNAGVVEEKKISGDEMTHVKDCVNPKAVTLLVRGGTSHVVDEVERGVKDAIKAAGVALEDAKVLCGGGAPEIELSKKLREYAESVGGRQQLAIDAFSDAIEIIPKSLAENAGLDPIDILVDLRAQHEKGNKWYGIDVFSGKSQDMAKNNVVEPLRVKTQAIKSAVEATVMILRIDDVISSKGSGDSGAGMPAGMPPGGMGGMPPDMGGMY